LDGEFAAQYQIDFRTGAQTAIDSSRPCAEQRAACAALNRLRARGLLEADQFVAPGQSLSIDVWETVFPKRAREWQLPLIALENFGIFHDEEGFRSSAPDLLPLTPGAEACPFFDQDSHVVYKLFDLRVDGSLGKKLVFALNQEGEFEITHAPANLRNTVEKIALLNEIGAHPTEIVGLSDSGDYLIVKQPVASRISDFEADRKAAIESIRGILPNRSGLRVTACVVWQAEQTWLISDLHERNIMLDGDGEPTIIDALIGPVPPLAIRELRWLREASEDAKAWRLGLPLPERRLFHDSDDSEL